VLFRSLQDNTDIILQDNTDIILQDNRLYLPRRDNRLFIVRILKQSRSKHPLSAMKHNLDVSVEQYYLKDVLRALVHSILFHRSFADIVPIDVYIQPLNITYVRCDYDDAMDRLIEARISDFCKLFISDLYRHKQTLSIFFYTHQSSVKSSSWFSTTRARTSEWEQWCLNVQVSIAKTEPEQIASLKNLSGHLLDKLIDISQKTNEEKSHVPPITSTEKYPFPFEIVFDDVSWKMPWAS